MSQCVEKLIFSSFTECIYYSEEGDVLVTQCSITPQFSKSMYSVGNQRVMNSVSDIVHYNEGSRAYVF